MVELREIVERLRVGKSIKGIMRELRRHKTGIRKVKQIAERENWLDQSEPPASEVEVRDAYYAEPDERAAGRRSKASRRGFRMIRRNPVSITMILCHEDCRQCIFSAQMVSVYPPISKGLRYP